ncbi:MAG: hypothetical protein IKP23_00755 [Elusimicrobiaceae bacterium]|nr:hypothetical protein [Elusimicrobiaceae bacterium]
MKKMLNNIGAISKQVIVGGAIGVATLMVGIGLMNNFSSSGDSEKGFASNAIEKGYSSYEGTYSGADVDDIIAARNYAQSSRDGSRPTITGTDRLALRGRTGAQNTGVDYNAQAGTAGVSDNSTGYGAGEIEGMGTSGKVRVGVSAEDVAAAQAQRDAKIAKGKELGDKARATLKTSKIADGSGIKGIETGSTSMVYGGIGNNRGTSGTLDSSKVALAKANANNLKGASGSIGAMGMNSTSAEGQARGRSALGGNHESIGDLGRASKYSMSGKNAVVSDAAKGAADAAAAFDGSQEAEAVNLQGENLQQAALNALDDLSGLDTSKIKDSAAYIKQQTDKYNELVDKANTRYWAAFGVAMAGFIAAFAVIEAKAAGPWCYLIAGAICVACAAAISGVLWGGADSYANSINQIDALSQANGGITPGKGEMWGAWGLFGMLNALMATAFIPTAAAAVAMGFVEEMIRMRKPSKM